MKHTNLANNIDFTLINKHFLALLVFFVIPISGLSIDIYIPSLPAISHYFGTSKAFTQYSITSYMAGLGIMQLFAGIISDSLGRKKPFLIAIFSYFLASACILFVTNIQQLLVLRFIQGMMVAITVVPMRSVISDLFEGKEYYKMVNYMTMAWSIGPIIAPAIGGYLQHYFGWRSNFYFLTFYSFLGFILVGIFLPETSKHRHRFHLKEIALRYKMILSNQLYWISLIYNSFLYSIVILFAITGPFLIQIVLHRSAIEFGHIALITGFAWFAGTLTNRLFIHVPLRTKSIISFWLMLIVAIVSFAFNYINGLSLNAIVIPVILLLWLGGIIFPNNFARSIALFPKVTGSANSLFAGFMFILTSIISYVGTYLHAANALPLLASYIVLSSICLIIFYVFE